MTRRLRCALAALSFLAASTAVVAQTPNAYPARPVRIIAPYGPGGAADTLSRLVAGTLGQRTGKTFIVENRPGAGGTIGLAALAATTADGYTLGLGAANMLVTNPLLYKSLRYDVARDFTTVGFLGTMFFALVVNPNVPARTVDELVAAMKAKPDGFSYGSSGVGNTAHIFGELFKARTGTRMVHVPYKSGGEALKELLGGRIQLAFSSLIDVGPQIEQGAVRALALAGSHRVGSMPSVPTLAEVGISGFETPTWFGIIAPAGTPKEIVQYVNREMRAAFDTPDGRAKLAQLGLDYADYTPEQFAAFLAGEHRKWERIIRDSGATVE